VAREAHNLTDQVQLLTPQHSEGVRLNLIKVSNKKKRRTIKVSAMP